MSIATASGAPRIVGGDVADPADWPFAVALTTPQGDQFCGGTVISTDAVVTASHCLVNDFGKPVKPRSVRVVTGRPDLSNESVGQELRVDKVFVHSEFLSKSRHDVAVLRLSDPTVATPALLPTKNEDATETATGSELRVAGYGSTSRTCCNGSDVLRDVATFTVKERKCSRAFPSGGGLVFHPGEEICTLGAPSGEHNTSSCFGDSGGPLIA
ncbi:MAG: serine protease, partial [Actinomycetota bacterium]|nr:serine protease [Actinomycetota bacterium]